MHTPPTRMRRLVQVILPTLLIPLGAVLADEVIATKSGDVYHTRMCSAAKRIDADNEITFKNEAAAEAAGRRKCKLCERIEEEEAEGGPAVEKPAAAKSDTTQQPGKARTVLTKTHKEDADKTAAPGRQAKTGKTPGTVKIVDAVSGDTLKSADGEVIRLLGVCAPELEQPGGAAAKQFLESKTKGREVDVTTDPQAAKSGDKHVSAYVKPGRGKDLSLALIESGLGWYDRDSKSSRKSELLAAEGKARKEQIGVWKPLPGAAGKQTVVVADSGTSYHPKDCVHLKRSKNVKDMTVNEAKSAGFVPCNQWMPLVEKKGKPSRSHGRQDETTKKPADKNSRG